MKLYIDFDGVIKDTIPYLNQELKKIGLLGGNERFVRQFFSSLDWSKFIGNIDVIEDAINTINDIVDSGIYNDVAVATHVNSLKEGTDKIIDLKNNKCKANIIIIPKEIKKCDQIDAFGNVLVDDYWGNLEPWQQNDGIGIRFHKERIEKEGYQTISSLRVLLCPTFVEEMKEESEGIFKRKKLLKNKQEWWNW